MNNCDGKNSCFHFVDFANLVEYSQVRTLNRNFQREHKDRQGLNSLHKTLKYDRTLGVKQIKEVEYLTDESRSASHFH